MIRPESQSVVEKGIQLYITRTETQLRELKEEANIQRCLLHGEFQCIPKTSPYALTTIQELQEFEVLLLRTLQRTRDTMVSTKLSLIR